MAKFEMDTDFIRKLAAILEETKLGEIEMADGERRIRGPRRRRSRCPRSHPRRLSLLPRPRRRPLPPPRAMPASIRGR
jgi:acetyl-CoA carboxylase biotin carboxyl carrier protein